MTTVRIDRNVDGIQGFSILGHSNFSEKGTDIVCAAISGIAQTCALGVLRVAKVDATLEKGDGMLSLTLPTELEKQKYLDSQIIFATMVEGLVDIAHQFPKHIQIIGGKNE